METFNCSYSKIVDIHKLQPNPKNPNKHPDKQIQMLAKIINYQGQRSPIVVSKRSGFITKGHGRLEAIKLLGWGKAAIDRQDYEDEAQEYADMVADNKIAELANHDDSFMIETLKELELTEIDPELLGIESLDFPVEMIPECDEDEVPEVVDPITKRGDVWVVGGHRVMCGDSTMINDVNKLMDGVKADMVFTDPPYGVEYQSNMRTKTKKFDVLKNDDKLLDIGPIIDMVSKGWVFIWTSWKIQNKWIELLGPMGYPSNMVIWHKPGGGLGDLKKTFLSDYEVALIWNRGAELTGKRIGSVWKINKDFAGNYTHPTQKPVELAEEALDKTTNQQSNILDLFLGSGSTLIACEKTNRVCYGMELDEHYCDVIIKRYMKYTGRDDVYLESNGKKYNELKNET